MSEATKQSWREEQAKAEIGHTDISHRLAIFLSAVFVAAILAVPVIQALLGGGEGEAGSREHPSVAPAELWRTSGAGRGEKSQQPTTNMQRPTSKGEGRERERSLASSAFSGVGSEMAESWRSADSLLDRFLKPNAVLLKRINEFASAVDDGCFLTRLSAGPVQEMLSRLGAGNEKVFVGRDGWLFYEPAVKYLTGAPFLDPARLRKRSRSGSEYVDPPQPDPVKGIVHFYEQLKKRGIELIVVPAPVKASIYPEKLSRRYGGDGLPLQNESFAAWMLELRAAGVHVFDPAPLLVAAKREGAQYLKTDTHWRPEAMAIVADQLAVYIESMPARLAPRNGPEPPPLNRISVSNTGDIAAMLKLPADQTLFEEESVAVRPMLGVEGAESEVLLLGDSFANIYSLPDMGWGEGAGFAEHLEAALKRPVESITRNDAGAFATREQLSLEMLRGNHMLAGKKLVIWEFAARELSVGDWKLIDLVLGASGNAADALNGQQSVAVRGRVAAVSGRPVKGAPYRNFIMKLFLKGMTGNDGASYGDGVVHVYGMRDREVLPVAAVSIGSEVSIELKPWSNVRQRISKMKTGMFDDMSLEIDQALYWGEGIKEQGAGIKEQGAGIKEQGEGSKEQGAGSKEQGAGSGAAERFWQECGRMFAEAGEDAMTVKGLDGWLFLKNELRHISAGRFWGEYAGAASRAASEAKKDPLPVILDVKKQLDALGIDLMLLPVPPKALANPDKLFDGVSVTAGKVPRLDVAHQEFYKLLREKGITVLDVFPELSARDGPLMYCQSDTHWSGAACVKVAGMVADRIRRAAWYEGAAKREFAAASREVEIEGDLGTDLDSDDPARRERLDLRFVSSEDVALEEDPHSPVLVMADSHGLVFSAGGDMHARGAGFFDQLAYELGLRPSLIAVRGSGATPTRIALYRQGRADPEFLSTKKVVVWLFAAREFTETSGWATLPVTRSE